MTEITEEEKKFLINVVTHLRLLKANMWSVDENYLEDVIKQWKEANNGNISDIFLSSLIQLCWPFISYSKRKVD